MKYHTHSELFYCESKHFLCINLIFIFLEKYVITYVFLCCLQFKMAKVNQMHEVKDGFGNKGLKLRSDVVQLF